MRSIIEATQRNTRARMFVCTMAVGLPVLCWRQSLMLGGSSAPPVLRVDQTLTTPQRADQKVSYVFVAAAGQSYLIEVQQHGLHPIIRNLLQEELQPAEALRHAQHSVASEPRLGNPYFWSAFVLVGAP